MKADGPALHRLLVIATKSPHLPIGGGNVALHGLLTTLQARGIEVRVLTAGSRALPGAPYAVRHVSPARRWAGLVGAAREMGPVLFARYRTPALVRALEGELATFHPDVVHIEQIQVGWLLPRLVGRVATVLRQQNVESRILERLAAVSWPPLRWALRREAHSMARAERLGCERASVVGAISRVDADRFRVMAPAARVRVLPPMWTPAPPVRPVALAGEPAFLSVGSFDWRPNRDGVAWLLREVWPIIRATAPGARLHIVGPGSASVGLPVCGGVVRVGSLATAAALYDARAVSLIPVRAGSGVRMRLIETWAQGVPAVTTPIGGEGLLEADGDGAVIATSAPSFADAALRLASDASLRAEIVARGRARLAEHAPERIVGLALEIYAEAARRFAAETTTG
jgi:glycosyltransferase involved in cell wall biosynthesis